MEISLLLRGLAIGLAIAAPVGPIGILCIRQSLAFGWLHGFVAGLGAATADAMYGCVAAFGLTFVTNFLIEQQFWLRLVGGAFLCYLGVKTFISIPSETAASTRGNTLTGVYTSTWMLTLTNPATILAFAAIFSGLGLASIKQNYPSAILLVVGVFCGSALWWLLLSTTVTLAKTKLNLNWVNRLSGIVIVAFGIVALLNL
jgi:threonine/homoserine/homoserine lactone efflux protein